MKLAIFSNDKLGLDYYTALNDRFEIKMYNTKMHEITEKNIILCIEDICLLKKAISCGKNILYPFPLFYCIDDFEMLLLHHNASIEAGSIDNFNTDKLDVKRIVLGNYIGDVGLVNITRKSGECSKKLYSLLARDIELIISLFGQVKQVYAMKRQLGNTALILTTLRFKNKTIVNIEVVSGYLGKPYEKGEYCGTAGILKYDSRCYSSFIHISSENEKVSENNYISLIAEPHVCQVKAFIENLKSNDFNTLQIEKYKYLSLIMSAVNESVCTAKEVNIYGGEEDEKMS